MVMIIGRWLNAFRRDVVAIALIPESAIWQRFNVIVRDRAAIEAPAARFFSQRIGSVFVPIVSRGTACEQRGAQPYPSRHGDRPQTTLSWQILNVRRSIETPTRHYMAIRSP